ncbi:Arylsulfatase precursor [Anatilimnocola aggregata]|uniref:Arylsulfatase n=1 Tax=Anatilimnocola aggregata TaxID=2528021 RepID=A0A517Y5H8_9BACT|nr:sulfatase-like hydrolase/transferase [Anatilimnocola aggregata]QDU25456.1 Arylsulfatase precursor [Anatilimnocola aggregata]
MKSPLATIITLLFLSTALATAEEPKKPNIIFVMADDMGWGETGYRNHPALKTPHLDAMAAGGLRFERFYAGCPVCSPTRASVLTGRSNDRTGVLSHGYALRLQEKTIAQALQQIGYVTGHFGKWHLNGMRGPGAPVLGTDPRHPGVFGFDQWVSVTNFYDLNPLMSRAGQIEEFTGDSSEIAVAEAVKFIDAYRRGDKPLFAVIWFGSPHSPFRALPEDKAQFPKLNDTSANHYGELVALDRSVGTLRQKLRDTGLADNTLLVFCSDNGGLSGVFPETVGGLRGHKGTVFEGGLRVPGIIEWPAVIKPRVTNYPACTMDLFPTVSDILKLPASTRVEPVDGLSLQPLFAGEIGPRSKPIPFRFQGQAAWIDNRYKLLTSKLSEGEFQLFDLEEDGPESRDLTAEQPAVAARLKKDLLAWNESVEASFMGKDYPEGKLNPPDLRSKLWTNEPEYQEYLPKWQKRPEYRAAGKGTKK